MYPMEIRRRSDNFGGLRRLDSMLDEMLGGLASGGRENGTITSAWTPACDVFEEKDGIKIVAELPGVRPADVKLSVENNMLTIRGEKRQEAEEKAERVHRYERTYGVFERTFALPNTVDVERIDAHYDAGLLTVVLPKAERARPREIQIRQGADGGANATAR